MTPKDLLATADVLAGSFLGTSPLQEDDIDSLVNKRLVIVFFSFFSRDGVVVVVVVVKWNMFLT